MNSYQTHHQLVLQVCFKRKHLTWDWFSSRKIIPSPGYSGVKVQCQWRSIQAPYHPETADDVRQHLAISVFYKLDQQKAPPCLYPIWGPSLSLWSTEENQTPLSGVRVLPPCLWGRPSWVTGSGCEPCAGWPLHLLFPWVLLTITVQATFNPWANSTVSFPDISL